MKVFQLIPLLAAVVHAAAAASQNVNLRANRYGYDLEDVILAKRQGERRVEAKTADENKLEELKAKMLSYEAIGSMSNSELEELDKEFEEVVGMTIEEFLVETATEEDLMNADDKQIMEFLRSEYEDDSTPAVYTDELSLDTEETTSEPTSGPTNGVTSEQTSATTNGDIQSATEAPISAGTPTPINGPTSTSTGDDDGDDNFNVDEDVDETEIAGPLNLTFIGDDDGDDNFNVDEDVDETEIAGPLNLTFIGDREMAYYELEECQGGKE
jgi:hypothetical protein